MCNKVYLTGYQLRKLFSIFLIFSFIFNAGAYLLIYLAFQYSLKAEASEKISSGMFSSKYEIITFSKEEIRKGIPDLVFLNGKEFLYKGKMFDIVKTVHKNNSVYFYCLPDKDEDRLNHAYNNNVDKNNDDSGKKAATEKLTKNIISEALIPGLSIYLYKKTENNYRLIDKKFSPQDFSVVPTPPPDFPIS